MNPKDQLEKQITTLREQLEDLKSVIESEEDIQIRQLYQEEVCSLNKQIEALEESLNVMEENYSGVLQVKRSSNFDDGNNNNNKNSFNGNGTGEISPNVAILEVRPGTGGDEASLFAGQLFEMYRRYAEKVGWKVEIVNMSEGNVGGVKLATMQIKGQNVYPLLKHESGVHRVQRIPVTESGGRIHTSTATVAVLPVVNKIEIEIKPDDLKWEFFRASGHGGQNVNKVSTAVRLTHIPTGILVECQEERFQAKNREKALILLTSRLYSEMQEQQVNSISQIRASQVGKGERVEKIRTYNFPQDRLTDHRIKKSWHNLSAIMAGNIGDIINSIDNNY